MHVDAMRKFVREHLYGFVTRHVVGDDDAALSKVSTVLTVNGAPSASMSPL